MDITPLIPKGRQLITGYGNGGFKINNEFVEGSVLVFPNQTLSWGVTRFEAMNPALLIETVHIARETMELLLIGTGTRMMPVADDLRNTLKQKGIALEAMDTGAACRTYNVLMSEERRIAAALIAI